METKSTASTNPPRPSRAAHYVRMSTEHQQYSPENQLDVIHQYAASHQMEISKVYSDHGRSGLNIAGREGLNRLMADVEKKQTDFSDLLVYDVSRWGRFQDVDESAYYEYVLKRAGIRVHYCAEQFENDGSMSSSVLKTLKRSMAAEYSRELSVKVFSGQCRLIELGFRQGGPAGYGLRRQLIDQNRNPKGLLGRGERKSLQTDRVILMPGPEEEVETVRKIYDLFVTHGKTEREIMETLNGLGVLGEHGRLWTRSTVHQVLTNPKYIGANIYNRRSFKLKHKRVKNPTQMWIWRDGAFDSIITVDLFERARTIIESRHRHLSDEELLERLKELLRIQGRLSGVLINETDDMPSSGCYSSRFGSLARAYELIGWTPERDFAYVEINRRLRRKHADLIASVLDKLLGLGATVSVNTTNDLLTINSEYTASLILARCHETSAGNHRWRLRFDESLRPDIIIAARLQPGNEDILDYYLLPRVDVLAQRLNLRSENGLILDVYRFNNLNFFMEMAARASGRRQMKEQSIERIPIAEINIANPRPRSRGRWLMIVANIREVGLKKPITVVRRSELGADGKRFDLVCGQGRIEAFLALGETSIPAIIAEASREDQFLMSLIENIARRPPSNRDILREVRSLRERSYSVAEIAKKIGMERMYISGIVHLIEHKEVALIEAVEAGRLPISVAVQIANGKDREVSEALSEAYESGQLRGNKLAAARRLIAKRIEKRQKQGKEEGARRKVTGNMLVQVYKQRVREQKALIAKAELTKERLMLVASVMRQLLADENFFTLLRAESIADMPKQLMGRLS